MLETLFSVDEPANELKDIVKWIGEAPSGEVDRTVLTAIVPRFKPRLLYFTSCCSGEIELCKLGSVPKYNV